jgi:hypothetical protein
MKPDQQRPPWIVWAGLAAVLAAAAVLSFDALRGLALAVGIADGFAWLLPIAVDAGAAVSCATWLGGRTHPDAARFAGRMTWALLGVTVLGNAGQLAMHANHITPPWWVAVLVGSIPPAVVGATVHLIVLLVRRPLPELAGDSPDDSPDVPPVLAEVGAPDAPEQPVDDPAAQLIAQGLGRRRLARELSIPESQARTMLAAARNGSGS